MLAGPRCRRVVVAVLTVIDGQQMSAERAAWSMIADAAESALKLPGLPRVCTDELRDLQAAALRCCAGLPVGEGSA